MIRVRAVRSFGVGPWLEQHRRGFKMPFLAGLVERCRAVESLKVDSGAGFNECGGHSSMVVPTGSKQWGGVVALHPTAAVVFIRLVRWPPPSERPTNICEPSFCVWFFFDHVGLRAKDVTSREHGSR